MTTWENFHDDVIRSHLEVLNNMYGIFCRSAPNIRTHLNVLTAMDRQTHWRLWRAAK